MTTLDLSSPRYLTVPRERVVFDHAPTNTEITFHLVAYAHAHKISVRDVDARLWREERS